MTSTNFIYCLKSHMGPPVVAVYGNYDSFYYVRVCTDFKHLFSNNPGANPSLGFFIFLFFFLADQFLYFDVL